MSVNREKSSSVMGLVLSLLLHGIFFAGCLALDAASVSGTADVDQPNTEIKQVVDQQQVANSKS